MGSRSKLAFRIWETGWLGLIGVGDDGVRLRLSGRGCGVYCGLGCSVVGLLREW